jgi:hypothetical protein
MQSRHATGLPWPWARAWGLREGETFGLTVPRVDFLRRKVHVLSQAQRGQLGADLKTEASTRTVPADEWVLNEISTHV